MALLLYERLGARVAVNITGALSVCDDWNIGIDRKIPIPFIQPLFPVW